MGGRTFVERRRKQIAIDNAKRYLEEHGLPPLYVAECKTGFANLPGAHEVMVAASSVVSEWYRTRVLVVCARAGVCVACQQEFDAGTQHWCLLRQSFNGFDPQLPEFNTKVTKSPEND